MPSRISMCAPLSRLLSRRTLLSYNRYTILSRRMQNEQIAESDRRMSRTEPEPAEKMQPAQPEERRTMEDQDMAFVDFTYLTPGPDLGGTDIMMDLTAPLDDHDFTGNNFINWDAYVGNNTNTLSHWATDPPLLDSVIQHTNSLQDLSQFFSPEDIAAWSNTDAKYDASKPITHNAFDFDFNQPMDLSNLDEPMNLPDASTALLLDVASGYDPLAPELQIDTVTATPQDSDSPGSMLEDNPAKITLTIHNPSSLTVEQLMKIAMGNKSGFRFERD